MKLKSERKLKKVQIRVNTNEEIAGLLERYVVYANTHLGHNFADVKELVAEIVRAFVEGERGFKAWVNGGYKATGEITLTSHGARDDELTFANGLSDEQTKLQAAGEKRVGAK